MLNKALHHCKLFLKKLKQLRETLSEILQKLCILARVEMGL